MIHVYYKYVPQEEHSRSQEINKINYQHETIHWCPFQPIISFNIVTPQSFSESSIDLLYTGTSTNITGLPTTSFLYT